MSKRFWVGVISTTVIVLILASAILANQKTVNDSLNSTSASNYLLILLIGVEALVPFFIRGNEQKDKAKTERLNKIDAYHRQLNDRILTGRWLATQVESFIPEEGSGFPKSRYSELRLYVRPILKDVGPYVPLKMPRDSSYTGDSVQDWYLNDALLHLQEFPYAFQPASKAKELVGVHNKNVRAFVELEDGIHRKLDAISIKGMGLTYDVQPQDEQFNIVALLWYFDKKYQKDSALSAIKVVSIDGGYHIYFLWGRTSYILARTKDSSKTVQIPILIEGWWEDYKVKRAKLQEEIVNIQVELGRFKREVEKLTYLFVYGLALKRTCEYESELK